MTSVRRRRAKTPFGSQWQYAGAKVGGVNRPGKHGGVYQDKKLGTRALFKQDTQKEKVRVAKVMGEGFAGPLLNAVFDQLGVESNRVAQVELVRAHGKPGPDETGQETYLKSEFIKGYQEDFWKFAYRRHFEAKYRAQFADFVQDEKKLNFASQIYFDRLFPYYSEKYNSPRTKAAFTDKYNNLTISNLKKLLQEGNTSVLNDLAHDLAEVEVNEMKRPSAVLKTEPRRVASKVLDTPEYRQQFAEITAPRLLFADFGVHNGNFGVAKIDGEDQLVCLDYGAAFCKFPREVNPYTKTKTGTKFYKNHFLEYNKSLIASKEMANVFIKIGMIDDSKYRDSIDSSVKMLEEKYGIEPLKKFCQRLGMNPKEYNDLSDKNEVANKIREFMNERLISRKESLKEQGYALLLEHCIDKKGHIDNRKLSEHLRKYDDFYEFAVHRFPKMKLVVHSKLLPEASLQLKDKLITAAKNNAPIKYRLDHYVRLAEHYHKQAMLAAHSANGQDTLDRLQNESQRLRVQLKDLKNNPNVSKTDEQARLIDQALESITKAEKYFTAHEAIHQQIAHFSSDSVVVTAPTAAVLESLVKEKVSEFSRASTFAALKHDQIAATNEFLKNNSARVNRTQVESSSRMGLFNKSKHTMNLMSVQRIKDNQYVSELYFDPKEIKRLGADGYLRWGIIEIENFLRANKEANSKIIIGYGVPNKLVEAMMTYCEWRKNNVTSPAEKAKYDCINQTSHKFTPSKEDVHKFDKKLDKYKDRHLGVLREYGLLEKEQSLYQETKRRASDPPRFGSKK